VAGVTTKFGQLALAGAGLTLAIEGPKMAFEALKKAGEFLGEAMAKVVEKSSEHAAKLQEIALEEQKFELAMRQVEKGTISLGGSLGELSQNYKLLSVASGTASDAVVAAMDKIAGAKQPVIQGFDDLAKAGDAMGALVEGSFHKSQFAGDQFATQNAARIRELQKMYQEFGEAMPAGLRKAVDALDALAAKQRAMNEEMRRLNKEYTTDLTAQYGALEKTIQAYKDGNLTRDQAISGLEKEAAALIKAGDAAGLSAKQKLEMAKAIDSARERMESEVVSTDAASEATRALAEAMDKLKAAMPRTVEEIEKQTRAAAEYARAMNEAKQATEDMATAQQQTADMMKAANLGGVMEQLAGGVSKAAAGTMATMTLMETHTVYASEQMVAAVKNVSAAFKELATTNSDMADRAANAVALLQEAWQSGIADMQSWLRQWHLYYDQLEQMIAKNPGSKVAKDLQKVVDMLDELKKRVESGEIQPGEKINL
jgi:methyl-accepting chemotaxis protein